MNDRALKELALAVKVASLAEDTVARLERVIGDWPAEFRVIVWEAVAETAAHRAREAKFPASKPTA